jgi:glycolate oxidase FAD binding subunit
MTPNSEQDLAEAVRDATGPLRIVGGGTRQQLGNPISGDVLSTAKLNKITLYEPSALTIVAQAGTPVSEIEAALAAEGQQLPFEPMDHRGLFGTTGEPTIGAVAACNISGPRRIQGIAARDSMIGVRFVDGMGNTLKNGGRVMKNVTGYDLVKLMGGSFGTLGVCTEISLKVLPRPEACAVIHINGLDDHCAVKAMSMALGSPYDITGAAHAPVGINGTPNTMIRVEGLAKSVSYRAHALQMLLSSFGDIEIDDDPISTAVSWEWIRDVSAFDGTDDCIWRISVTPSQAPALVKRLSALGEIQAIYDWGGGLVWISVPKGSDLRPLMKQGHATIIRSNNDARKAELGAFHPEHASLASISQGLREKFDPRGILNTGIMG